MKVALVISKFDPALGGAEQWSWQFAHWLAARQQEVHIVASRFGSQAAESPFVLHRVHSKPGRLGFAEAAAARLQSLSMDIVHDMGAGWQCDVFQPHGGSRQAAIEQNLLLSPKWLRPVKRHLTHLLPRYRQFQQLSTRQYARDGRTVVAVSQMVARQVQEFHGVLPEQIRVIYNGVDCQRFSPQHQVRHREQVRQRLGLRDEVLLLIVAHNFALKGVPTLIAAAGRLRAAGAAIHLALVGGKRLGPYLRMARQARAKEAITFVGPLADAAPFYAAADVYVQPTFYDPCSLVVLEALASGLPVVTSRFNGAGELLTPGRQGYLIDEPDDVEALAACIEKLLDSSDRQRMGKAARQLAQQHTLERNCEEMMSVYEQLARQRKAA